MADCRAPHGACCAQHAGVLSHLRSQPRTQLPTAFNNQFKPQRHRVLNTSSSCCGQTPSGAQQYLKHQCRRRPAYTCLGHGDVRVPVPVLLQLPTLLHVRDQSNSYQLKTTIIQLLIHLTACRLQPVKETRERQTTLWCDLILQYCRQQKVALLSRKCSTSLVEGGVSTVT